MSTATLSSVREIEQAITSLRVAPGSDGPYQRTSVMTHIAWVPEEWVEAAEDVLAALAERHPSRTLALMPYPDADDGLEGSVEISCYPVGEGREICTETIRIRLNGKTTLAPESIVQPLFLPDLPVSLRWRGTPAFGERPFERLVDVADRLIVDSTEWPGLPAPYERLAGLFERVIVSDIAWARTSRWRSQLATMWPGIADVRHIRVVGTEAQAYLLAGWLRSRLERHVKLEHEPAEKLVEVDIDGEPAPFPPGDPPHPSDLLSDELDRFSRDPIFEAAVRATTG
jgi:glucose-6-phosphate dehydrogenase assembly protein OpcA